MSTIEPQPVAVADVDAFTVTRTIRIAATRARVWQALTQEEHISGWFGDRTELPERRVGGEGAFIWDDHGAVPVRIEQYDEPDVFAYTWGSPGQPLAPGNATLVRFTLADDGDGTLLTVVETGFGELTTRDPRAELEDHRRGWSSELDELVGYLEPVRSA
ncbi:SRPBCC domain-containing protein [Cellulomonas fimi]|uniref:Activator of Hsp90 ATPase 1 family protein n=1 Tax=Cellulomonas fimi (strain ATCC 484 / DSM 20113 / JCM 1341 / CCUG 24087 / LMG 16345 / NBRC 15513 / NCIMB 8980 / NCTC 7547 / NRS-133) TaxID=590998 RepID=F4H143_CELFA|nr:SRPBCC domain-containing protein [Cellulomonas fimi]AEE47412.1 Activator of Hsp90 ATPase 1 family protein [Cellulomonas fimi ATCC 484]VEH36142.1 Activator of Hsp90 ATPase homolog 1-like protein [Cellulomonas fimi]